MFPSSSLTQINRHIEESKNTKWMLCMDRHRFHVYVVAVTNKQLGVRIDWNKESTLTFEKYEAKPGEEAYFIGHNDFFCKLCLEEKMASRLEQYQLFKFNCRTVSFMILVLVGFDAHHIYDRFEQTDVLCGLDQSECLKAKEMSHFFKWEAEQNGCTLL